MTETVSAGRIHSKLRLYKLALLLLTYTCKIFRFRNDATTTNKYVLFYNYQVYLLHKIQEHSNSRVAFRMKSLIKMVKDSNMLPNKSPSKDEQATTTVVQLEKRNFGQM